MFQHLENTLFYGRIKQTQPDCDIQILGVNFHKLIPN